MLFIITHPDAITRPRLSIQTFFFFFFYSLGFILTLLVTLYPNSLPPLSHASLLFLPPSVNAVSVETPQNHHVADHNWIVFLPEMSGRQPPVSLTCVLLSASPSMTLISIQGSKERHSCDIQTNSKQVAISSPPPI